MEGRMRLRRSFALIIAACILLNPSSIAELSRPTQIITQITVACLTTEGFVNLVHDIQYAEIVYRMRNKTPEAAQELQRDTQRAYLRHLENGECIFLRPGMLVYDLGRPNEAALPDPMLHCLRPEGLKRCYYTAPEAMRPG
jgi:hypothetical protein